MFGWFQLLHFYGFFPPSSPRSSPPDHEGLVHSFPLSLPASLQPSPAAIGKPLASTISRRCHPPFLWPEPLALVQSSRSLVLGKLGSLALSRILPPDSQRLRETLAGWMWLVGSFRSVRWVKGGSAVVRAGNGGGSRMCDVVDGAGMFCFGAQSINQSAIFLSFSASPWLKLACTPTPPLRGGKSKSSQRHNGTIAAAAPVCPFLPTGDVTSRTK